jgi:ABC-type transport system involved in multi-copper enzyme maturation permease subunit
MIELVKVDLLKLRKRRGLFWWSLILSVGSMLVFTCVKVILHANDPIGNGPAGGVSSYVRAMDVLSLTAVVAGALIGATAGTGDRSAGVLRDLIATGRSRTALSVARIPAMLAMILPMVIAAYLVGTSACYAFASGLATPSASQVTWYGVFIVTCGALASVVAMGLAELTGSRGIAIGVLLGWFLAGERLLFSVSVLGRARAGLAGIAVDRLRPLLTPGELYQLDVSLVTAIAVVAGWLLVFSIAGAWREQTRDA